MKLSSVVAAAALVALGAGTASAMSVKVVDRGLPANNLNNAAGANRSNVAWGFGGDFASGDTFSLASTGNPALPNWRIDSLTGWVIAGEPGSSFTLDSRFSDVSLFLGPSSGTSGDTIDQVATSSITGNVADAPNVSISPVTYAGGADYQGSSGSAIQLWEITFSDLGVFAPGDYAFSIIGESINADIWFNHASNATLGGVPANGADDAYLWLHGTALDSSLEVGGMFDSNGSGWDKSSDINVVVNATPVPLPAGAWLMLSFIGGFGVLRRVKARGAA